MDEDPFAHAIVRPEPKTPERVAATALDVKLGERLPDRPPLHVWRAKTKEGEDVALVVFDAQAPEPERQRLATAIERMRELSETHAIAGVLRIRAIAPKGDAFTCDLWTTGTAEDLHALNWPLRTRGDFVRRVFKTLEAVHRAGIVHGSLCPKNVQLDDQLQPVLADVGLSVMATGTYAAPELRDAAKPDVRSDIFSAGRLLHYLTIEGVASPHPGLAAIVKVATAASPGERYASAAQLGAALDPLVDQLEATQARAPAAAELPPIPRRASVAEITAARDDGPPRPLPKWIPLVGLVLAVVSFPLAFLVGPSSAVARTMLMLLLAAGGAVATLFVPAQTSRPLLVRSGLAIGAAALLLVTNPLSILYRAGAQSRIQGDDATRIKAVTEILQLGKDLRGAHLAGLKLVEFDFTTADLRGADMTGADLTRANLWASKLDGASLSGASLAGADVSGSTFGAATGQESASCNETTKFPEGWRCLKGTPQRGAGP